MSGVLSLKMSIYSMPTITMVIIKIVFLHLICTVLIPEGVDDAAVRSRLLKEFHIEIGGGLGPLAGKIWRIGLMGETSKKESIQKLMDAFRKILN